MALLALEIYTIEYEVGGLDRLKSCGAGSFEELAMIYHLILDILSGLHAQRGVVCARAGPETG
jgi:hypothetical protein